jgi:hypothetical protein
LPEARGEGAEFVFQQAAQQFRFAFELAFVATAFIPLLGGGESGAVAGYAGATAHGL